MSMKKLLLAGAAWLGLTIAAHAQVTSAIVVASCGTPPVSYVVGQPYPLTMDTTGKLCNLTGSGGGTVAGSQSNASDAIAPTATNVPSNSYLWGLDINGVFDRIGVALANAAASAAQTALVTTISPNSAGLITLGQTTKANSVPVTMASDQPGTATAAGQNPIGNVGGINKRVCYNPTVTNGTYAANVVMGGLDTAANLFTSTGTGVIQSVELDFTTAQTVAFKLYYFEANPSNSTWTDHSAAAINATDSLVVGGYVSLSNADSGLGSSNTVYSAIGLGIPYSPAGTNGYFVLVPTATTNSLGATTNGFNLCVTVLQNS